MSTKVDEIINIIENLAPLRYAYQWDNVGLQIGSRSDEVQRVLITLEVTDEVLEEAVKNNVDMIISHHPLIFSPLKKIIKEDLKGKLLYKAIRNNISVYSTHTNMDIAPNGLNDYVANLLGLKDMEVLDVTEKSTYYKLAIFTPVGHEEKVAEAICSAGAGHIGNYSNCTFRVNGTGTFLPLEGTNPFIGAQGQGEKVEEIKIETIVPQGNLKSVVKAMLKVHPYEEVAYDIYPLENEGPVLGIGRMGYLPHAVSIADLANKIKDIFNIEHIKIAGDLKAHINKVAIINGSGAEYIKLAMHRGCQCVITGDVKYHDAQDAISQGMNVIDMGHYHSEKVFPKLLIDYLSKKVEEKDLNVEIIQSSVDINPFQLI